METYDALVVGGGIAGSATAAALAQRGLRTLLCEAGLPNEKRLAGELMHPPSAARLSELGLLEPLLEAGAVPSHGFAIFRAPDERATILPYADVPGLRATGLALDHAVMTRALLAAVSRRTGVTVWADARVQSVDFDLTVPRVQITRCGAHVEVEARVVVSAEGRESKLRSRANISTAKAPAFHMLGWKVPGGRLPVPGHGHVFLGADAPILAYSVSRDEVRIMFEGGLGESMELKETQLEALPEPFRSDVRRAIVSTKPQRAKVYGMLPARYTGDRLALVGDAGGCVHPITASGIAYCTADAIELAACLAAAGLSYGAIAKALARYQQRRRGPMRTRATLGPAVLEALVGDSPDMMLLRHGLFRYWDGARGRRRSMCLLSTHDQSMRSMVIEYAAVGLHALTALAEGVLPASEVPAALSGLARRTAGYAWHGLQRRASDAGLSGTLHKARVRGAWPS